MKEDYSFATKEGLFSLQSFKLNQYCSEQRLFYNLWIQKKLCPCIDKLNVGEMLNCKHFRTALKKEFEKKEKKLWNITVELIKSGTNTLQFSDQRLDSLKR